MSDFYIYTLIIYLVIFPIAYYCFRDIVHQNLLKRRRIRKRDIRKSKKGIKNFWWYEDLHRQYDLDILYRINKIITVYYPLTFALFIMLGWITEFKILIAILYISVYIIYSVSAFICCTLYNKINYGKAFVLLGYWGFKKNGYRTHFTIDSSLIQPIYYLIFPSAMTFGTLYVIFN